MSDKAKLSSELASLEKLLGQLDAPAAKIDRDQVMYQSGRAAALAEMEATSASMQNQRPIRTWVWPATTVMATTAAVIFGIMLFLQNGKLQSDPMHEVATGPVPTKVENPEQLSVEPADSNPTNQKPDLLKLVMDFRGTQPLDAGFALKPSTEFVAQDETLEPTTIPSNGSVKTNRQLMDELIPKRPSKKANWSPFQLLRKS